MQNDSRAQIFAAMRSATPGNAPPIQRAVQSPLNSANRYTTLQANLKAAGGEFIEVQNHRQVEQSIPNLADAAHVWSGIETVASRGVALSASREVDLAELDWTILPGQLAVAENGAVWNVPRTPLERAAALLAHNLALIVSRRDVVDTLHDAYAVIEPACAAFGWFLSGPSKTADIEQALVLGAHGPCTASLILVSD
jgi:L-lactate dehydrogenase complex protein LldG